METRKVNIFHSTEAKRPADGRMVIGYMPEEKEYRKRWQVMCYTPVQEFDGTFTMLWTDPMVSKILKAPLYWAYCDEIIPDKRETQDTANKDSRASS